MIRKIFTLLLGAAFLTLLFGGGSQGGATNGCQCIDCKLDDVCGATISSEARKIDDGDLCWGCLNGWCMG